MIVVADTSPLNYLIQIGCESLLPELYTRVIVPAAVLAELGDPSAPSVVGQWLLRVPEWIDVKTTSSAPDTALAALDPGEQQAIQLAEEEHADLLLIDERKGRVEARRRGLTTTGTLGVLLAAAERGSIDAAAAFRRLIAETTFRSTPALQRNFLQQIQQVSWKNT